jgi:hypothetical protein
MIINFKTHEISRDTRKLTRTPTLITKKKKNWLSPAEHLHNSEPLATVVMPNYLYKPWSSNSYPVQIKHNLKNYI